MGRQTTSAYVTPVKSDGVLQTASGTEFGRGSFTLVAGTTYYFPVRGADSPVMSIHAQWDAAIVLTTLTVEDCNMDESEVSNYADAAGDWFKKSTTTMFVNVEGAGVSNTSGVVDATGGALGGAFWNISSNGARRTRVAVVVGATGGELRLGHWGKE